jgi:hypothetical protein
MRNFVAALTFLLALQRLPAAPAVVAEIPFEYSKGLIWMDAQTDGSREPLHLLLDSGAEVSVIDLSAARRLSLPLGAKVGVSGVGSATEGYWPQALSASAGGVALPGKYLALDLSQASAGCERHVDGLVGLDFFRGRIVQIDFDAGKIRILKTADLEGTHECLPMETRPSGLIVKGSVESHSPQWLRLDTGCASSLQWVTRRLGHSQASGGNAEPAIGLDVVTILQGEVSVRLGNYTFRHVPAGLHQDPIFPGESGLLGTGLLTCFKTVTLDTQAGRMILGERHGSPVFAHAGAQADASRSKPAIRR